MRWVGRSEQHYLGLGDQGKIQERGTNRTSLMMIQYSLAEAPKFTEGFMADTSALHSTLLLTPKWPRKLGFAIGSLSVRCFLKRGNRVAGRVQQPTPKKPFSWGWSAGQQSITLLCPTCWEEGNLAPPLTWGQVAWSLWRLNKEKPCWLESDGGFFSKHTSESWPLGKTVELWYWGRGGCPEFWLLDMNSRRLKTFPVHPLAASARKWGFKSREIKDHFCPQFCVLKHNKACGSSFLREFS